MAATPRSCDPSAMGKTRNVRLCSSSSASWGSKRLAEIGPKYLGKGAPDTGAIPGIFDYVGSYLRERAASTATWGAKIAYQPHYYPWGATGHSPLGKRRTVLTVLDTDVKLYRKNADYNFGMLEEILKLARERGNDVVLYDQPLNASAAGPDWNGVVPAYRKRASALAARYDVPYVHIERHVALRDADFADLFHLLAPARLKWQPEMARELAATLTVPVVEPVATLGGRTAAALH